MLIFPELAIKRKLLHIAVSYSSLDKIEVLYTKLLNKASKIAYLSLRYNSQDGTSNLLRIFAKSIVHVIFRND